ncbi:hypothetical protein TREMEDRAFT_45408 [Tremella mesenterica DSM 1558]|uniref:uncharacterized protein n=1 Tax=Tremella mesenterica (strain ATCC 24925 / CBS 8224 / DSM 1558 / NBRC 9311 / NRRL Y-6157 / RJB 2259-6 / UBC 559-6) TaxID=578456 RepID=UPI0003F49DC2|nr:uncharacterized protein TREMEDRAFT_45408 [Tremella mesenterica DSM 1558]EIW66887.1 hypothetical protein TREMEDRAFT_45408 [Tremella mesenterica DSM 1558]
MHDKSWSLRSATYVWSLLGVLLSCFVYRSFNLDQTQSGSWGCEMSWMTPSYLKMEWSDSPIAKYSLFLYREVGWDTINPSGQPVLFIPGNAGHYKQARSIASSVIRQRMDHSGQLNHELQTLKGVDVFTADFNEELSAWHSQTLREQATFVVGAIHRILGEYDHLPFQHRPTQISLIGHSMGGIVARLALTMQDPKLVDVVITMSTPHLFPPAPLEYDMEAIYNLINSQQVNAVTPVLVSICGGVADTQIVSDACSLPPQYTSAGVGVTVFTTSMPGVWTPVEHQAMVWCHQVRWRIARTLLYMGNSTSRSEKLLVAQRWLVGDQSLPFTPHPISNSDVIHTFIVTSQNMTVTAQPKGFDWNDGSPVSNVEWCPTDSVCQPIPHRWEAIPFPADDSAPFPLPGEGCQPGDVAWVVTVGLPEIVGTLRLGTRSNVEVSRGPHLTTLGHIFREPCLSTTRHL